MVLGGMTMKEYIKLSKSLELVLYHQRQFIGIPKTPFFLEEGILNSAGNIVSVF